MNTISTRFAASAALFTRWLECHHRTRREPWIGFGKEGVEPPGRHDVRASRKSWR
jgi:hypothetical protein